MKLSIITINLNSASGLKRTIESVESQTFQDFQYIVIDGNSTDGSLEYITTSERINDSISEQDSGVYDAMNKGIDLAKGEYLLFLNSGDTLYSEETLMKIMPELDSANLIYGNLYLNDPENPRVHTFPEKLTFKYLFHHFLGHPSTFIKRSLFKQFGYYDLSYAIVADWAFMLTVIAKENAPTKHIEQVISIFEMDGMSANPANVPQILEERKQFLQKTFPLFYADYVDFDHQYVTWDRIRASKGFRLLKALGVKKFQ